MSVSAIVGVLASLRTVIAASRVTVLGAPLAVTVSSKRYVARLALRPAP